MTSHGAAPRAGAAVSMGDRQNRPSPSEEDMRIVEVRRLRGPNIYCSHPAVCALVDLEEFTGRETTEVPGFTARVLDLLPGLTEHHCATASPGGLVGKMARGTYFGYVIEHVALELSHLIGREVYFGRTLWAGTPGWFRLILECPDDERPGDPVAEQLLALALDLTGETAAGRIPDPAPGLQRIAALYEESRLGVSTAELARAARKRDIPVRRLSDVALLQLGHGCRRQLVWAASTGQTSAVGVDIACDKEVTKQLLAAAGIPVPEGVLVHSAAEAAEAFAFLGGPVVVKPLSGHHGQAIFVAHTQDDVIAAYGAAGAGGGLVLVESYIGGIDYRVLVVGGRVVAAAELSPARVTGDGISPIAALVDQVNAEPGGGSDTTGPSPGSSSTTPRSPIWPVRAWRPRRCQCPGRPSPSASTRTFRPAGPARTSPTRCIRRWPGCAPAWPLSPDWTCAGSTCGCATSASPWPPQKRMTQMARSSRSIPRRACGCTTTPRRAARAMWRATSWTTSSRPAAPPACRSCRSPGPTARPPPSGSSRTSCGARAAASG